MSLSVSKDKSLIPADAVALTRDEALQYQMILIKKWEPSSEVMGLKFGPGIMAFVAGVSGILVLAHFRKKLKLGVYGKVTSYFPGVVLPSALAALCHTTSIQNKILLRDYDCPLCLQSQAVFLQIATSIVYPFLLSPMASFMYATRHFTVRLPYITEQPKEWLRLWVKLTRSAKGLAGWLVAANIITAIATTTLELNQFENMQLKLDEFERKVENGSIEPMRR